MQAILDIAPRTLDLSNINKTTLSIGLRSGGFCFTIYCESEHKFLGLWHYLATSEKETENVFANCDLLKQPYNRVVCQADSPNWTLMPKGIITDDDLTSYWELNFSESAKGTLRSNQVGTQDIVCLYDDVNPYTGTIISHFPNLKLISSQTSMLNRCLALSQATTAPVVYADIQSNSMDLCVCEKGKLLLGNKYKTGSNNDVLYFVLNIYKHFGLDQNRDCLYLSGSSVKVEVIEKSLGKYLRHITIDSLPANCSYEAGIEKLTNKQEYINLFNTALCV